MNEVTIDGTVYVPKHQTAELEGMKYCIVRTQNAGVFAGYVKEKTGDEIVLVNSRRLWKWAGAASLSELAVRGVSKPDECKFPCEEPEKVALQVIEIITCTQKAVDSIKGVPEWTSH